MRKLLLPIIVALASLNLAAQDAGSAQSVAPSPKPAAQADLSAVRPGMIWGTVIRRDQFQPLTPAERWSLYWRQAFWTPGVYFRAAAIGGLDQRKNLPPDWGQGSAGYMKRVGNAFGRGALQDSLEAAGAAALQQDVRYLKCQCKGVLRKAAYAIGANFVTLDKHGNWVPAYARLGSAVGAEYIATAWMPPGYRNWNTSLRDAGLQFAFGSLFNLVREFIPSKKH